MHTEDPSSQKPLWQKYYRKIRNVAVTMVLILYLVLGAVIFHHLEAEAEAERQGEAALRLQQLIENLTCISRGELQQLLEVARELGGAKISPDANSNQTVQLPQGRWSIGRAFFFSLTVITTIGYGNLVPKTPGGQTFCLFYALFGIPLLLIVLGNIGSRIAQRNFRLTNRLFGCRLSEGSKRFCVAQFMLLVLVGMILFMWLPCIGFTYIEGWTYPESFYYAFITLSTIGFGDYVPDVGRSYLTGSIFIIWIPFGLAWFSSIISTVQLILERKIDQSIADNYIENQKETTHGVKGNDLRNSDQFIKSNEFNASHQHHEQQQQHQ